MRSESSKKVLFVSGIFLIAFILRFASLGTIPLSEDEAILALQAKSLASGIPNYGIAQPLYVLITAFIFKFFGPTDFTARLFPALMGIFLVSIPFFFSEKISQKKKYLFAFCLAIDPALVAWSRQADSLIPLIFLIALAIILFRRGSEKTAVALAALSFLGGERFFPFLAAAGIIFALIYWINRYFLKLDFKRSEETRKQVNKQNLLIFLSVLIVAGMGLLAFPEGINGIGNGIINGFKINVNHDFRSVGFVPLLIAFFVYEGSAVLLFLIKYIKSISKKEKPQVIAMSCMILFAAILSIFNQGILIIPWISLPLWFFSTDVILSFRPIKKTEIDLPMAIAILIPPILSFFLLLRLSEMLRMGDLSLPLQFTWQNQAVSTPFSRLQAYLLIIVICIIIFAVLLPMLLDYFSPGKIKKGMLYGCLSVLLVCTFGSSWKAAGFSNTKDDPFLHTSASRHELILGNQIVQIENQIIPIIQEIGWKATGFIHQASGIILVDNDPMLRWTLQYYPDVVFTDVLDIRTNSPSFVITEGSEYEPLWASYVGLVSDWKTTDHWEMYRTNDWLSWIIYRKPVISGQKLVIWQQSRFLTKTNLE